MAKFKPYVKPQPFWWAHEANAKSALIDMGEDYANIFQMGDGMDAAYCAVKKGQDGNVFYCDDMKWHPAHKIHNPPEITR